MARVETHVHDAADYIKTADDAVLHLEAAFEDGDPRVIAEMLGAVARSKGMSQIAEATGLSRESLYRALSAKGNPTLSTTLRVLKALGLRLTVAEPRSVARKAIEAGRQWRGGVTRRKRTMLCDCRRA